MAEEPISAYKPLRLKRPPIIEATIGVTVARLPDSTLGQLRESAIAPDRGYQGPQPITQSSLEMKIVEGRSTAVTKDQQFGWQWFSEDRLHAVQLKLDGFAFSRLGNYETWESFTAEAKRLWNLYIDTTGPISLLAFGVRYVNRVYLPQGADLANYLRVYPKEPEDRQWVVTESLMRLGMQIEKPQRGLFIHQHLLVPSDKADHVSVILDNDFRYEVAGLEVNDLWARIDAVREVKDDYFVQLITPTLLESFNV
jgi:uncharacterized protein (TIGR04255 family)